MQQTAAAAQLEDWLAKRGWSAPKLAAELGITKQRVYQILEGDTRPSLDVAVKLQEITGIPATAWVRMEQSA